MPDKVSLSKECLFEVNVEIPWQQVRERRSEFVRGIAGFASAPGFRRGRVPASVLARLYRNEFLDELKSTLVPRRLAEEVSKRDVHVASDPMIREVKFEEGKPLRVKGLFEVFPRFEIGEYRGIELTDFSYEVTDEMVEEQLEILRQRHASYQNLDPRPLAEGDIAVLNLQGYDEEGELVVDQDEYQFEVGDESEIPSISDTILGKPPGTELEFELDFSSSHENTILAGKHVKFDVEVTGLQRRDLPDLDDEFARDVNNNFTSFDELKESVRKTMEEAAHNESEMNAAGEVAEKLALAHEFPLPPLYMHNRVQNAWRLLKQRTGLEQDAPMTEEDEFLLRTIEETTVRAELLLLRIATLEGLRVTRDETEREIIRYAESKQMTPERAAQELMQNGALDEWRLSRLRLKAIKWVIDEAEIADPDEAGDAESSEQDRELSADEE